MTRFGSVVSVARDGWPRRSLIHMVRGSVGGFMSPTANLALVHRWDRVRWGRVPNFRGMGTGQDLGEEVVPLLRRYLTNPKTKPFTVDVDRFLPRPPDGKFHPSSHPLWTERQLYWYLVEPERMVPEPFDPHNTMAVTAGAFWHSFIEMCMKDLGLLVGDAKRCRHRNCTDDRYCPEVFVEDSVTGAQGSMDGQLPAKVWEFKTCWPGHIDKIEVDPLADVYERCAVFKAKWPGYYAQVQEYMRMARLMETRVVLLAPVMPYAMTEVAVVYDHVHSYQVEMKYLRAREAAAIGVMPNPCCAPGSKESRQCIARQVCPHGLAA